MNIEIMGRRETRRVRGGHYNITSVDSIMSEQLASDDTLSCQPAREASNQFILPRIFTPHSKVHTGITIALSTRISTSSRLSTSHHCQDDTNIFSCLSISNYLERPPNLELHPFNHQKTRNTRIASNCKQ